MTYDNIKSHKKVKGFTLTLEDKFFEKHRGRGGREGESGGGGGGRVDAGFFGTVGG